MNLALYTRESTDEQIANDNPRAHLEFLRDYARKQGHLVTREYVDGVSGTVPFADRPAGAQLLKDAKAGLFEAVLVLRVDRFSRKLRVLLEIQDHLEALGCGFKSAVEPIDTTNPMGRFMFHMLGSMAELERETIKDRSNLGRAQKVRDGLWTQGPVPYGYAVKDRRPIKSEHPAGAGCLREWEVAREIIERIAAGGTATGEAARLNALGIPNVLRSSRQVRPQGPWMTYRIGRLVKNPMYKGVKAINLKAGAHTQDVPALVDAQTWAAAVAQLDVNGHKGGEARAKRVYLLARKVRCGCGYAMAAFSTNTGFPYYRCPTHADTAQRAKVGKCAHKMTRADLVDQLVWEQAKELALHPNQALDNARQALQAHQPDLSAFDATIGALHQQIRAHTSGREKVLRLVASNLVTFEEAKEQLAELNAHLARCQAELEAAESERMLADAYDHSLEQATLTLDIVARGLELAEADPLKQRELLALIVREVQISHDQKVPALRIRWALPLADVCPGLQASTPSQPQTKYLTWDSHVPAAGHAPSLGAPSSVSAAFARSLRPPRAQVANRR